MQTQSTTDTIQMAKWEPTTRPVIVCAANQHEDGMIACGARHWDTIMRSQVRREDGTWPRGWSHGEHDQGFIDQFCRYYTREEAMLLARANQQIIVPDDQMLSLTALHSEDLY